jgi:LCP family protein required for cell wall assembly
VTRPDARRVVTRVRRGLVLGIVLALTVLVVPDSSVRVPTMALIRTDTVLGVDHDRDVVWILALGSDARLGQAPLRSRADAIQMVGVNLRTGTGTVIGIPRDSWVNVPGHGSNRVNSALYFGGPELMGRTVGDLVGVQPDYVFVTSFLGFRAMVRAIGGITVNSRLAFTDDNMMGSIKAGRNRLTGFQALFFSRARHFLPRGDFDRSANQQETLRGILREVRAHEDDPGFMERGVGAALQNMYTNLSPIELYRLAQSLTVVDPARFRGCVLNGSIGTVNGASIVFPDRAQATRLGNDARNDAQLDGGC